VSLDINGMKLRSNPSFKSEKIVEVCGGFHDNTLKNNDLGGFFDTICLNLTHLTLTDC